MKTADSLNFLLFISQAAQSKICVIRLIYWLKSSFVQLVYYVYVGDRRILNILIETRIELSQESAKFDSRRSKWKFQVLLINLFVLNAN